MDESIVVEYYQIIKNKIAESDFISAIRSAEKLQYNFPNNEYGYYYKAVCEFALEKYKDAIKNYQTAIQLNPLFAKAYFNLGICYSTLGYYDYALISIGRALLIFSKQKNSQAKQRCIEALKTVESERR